MKKILFIPFLLFIIGSAFVIKRPDDIVGVWQNGSGKGHVQIFKQGGKYYGKIVWLRDAKDDAGRPKIDRKNTDPSQRSRPLIGLVMLRDFEYSDGKWTNGFIYNPSDGKEYKGYMKMDNPNTLTVRGYIGISLFGKSDTWKRIPLAPKG
jgi:uncharacterized protein (DUF2147 family)